MAIIISDLHGNLQAAQAFLKYKPDEQHVCLGDMVDSRDPATTLADELACLDLLLESDAVLLWGNHELAYLPERPWRWRTGYHLTIDEIFYHIGNSRWLAQRYKENGDLSAGDVLTERIHHARDSFRAAYAVDGWLCTHAGVSPKLARRIPPEVIKTGAEAITAWLNDEFIRQLAIPSTSAVYGGALFGQGPLFNVPVCRGGLDEYGGIFWRDSDGEQSQPAREVGRQIFGHSPVPAPERGKSWDLSGRGGEAVLWINLDAREGHWVYDTRTDEVERIL